MSSKPSDPKSEGPVVKHASSKPRNSKEVSTGRSQMLSIDNIKNWDGAADQVLWCFILKAPVNSHCQLVRHSLRNVEPA